MPVIPGPVCPLPNPPVPGSLQNQDYPGLFWQETFETDPLAIIFDQALGSTASIDGTHAHSGSQALHISQTGTAVISARTINYGPAVVTGRFWFWIGSIPSATITMLLIAATGSNAVFNVAVTTGFMAAGIAGSTKAGTVNVCDGAWHVVDFRADYRGALVVGGKAIVDWQLDGVAQTQSTASNATAAVSLLRVGSAGAVTIDYWIDDIQLSDSYSAYPLADIAGIGTTFPISVTDTGVSESDTVATIRGRPVTDTGLVETDTVATTRLRAVTDTGLTETDTVATTRLRAVTDTGVSETDSVATTRVRVITTTGVTQTDTVATTRARVVADTGIAQTDTVATTRVRSITDTGLTETDTVATTRVRVVADTGVTETDSVATTRLRVVADTGISETDTVTAVRGPSITVTTTGVTQTDSVATQRARLISDTGISQTDSTSTLRARFITTTGVSQSDTVATTRARVLADTGIVQSDSTSTLRTRFVVTVGVTQTDVVAVSARRVRGVADQAATITDTVFVHVGVVVYPLRAYVGYVQTTAATGLVSGTGLTGFPAT